MKTQKEQIYSTGEEMNFELILDVKAGTEWKWGAYLVPKCTISGRQG